MSSLPDFLKTEKSLRTELRLLGLQTPTTVAGMRWELNDVCGLKVYRFAAFYLQHNRLRIFNVAMTVNYIAVFHADDSVQAWGRGWEKESAHFTFPVVGIKYPTNKLEGLFELTIAVHPDWEAREQKLGAAGLAAPRARRQRAVNTSAQLEFPMPTAPDPSPGMVPLTFRAILSLPVT